MKMRRSLAYGAFAVAGTVAGVAVALWYAPRWLLPILAGRYRECTFFVKTRQPLVALTIDDGPDARTTPRILATLAAHRVRATFFLITSRVPGNERIVARLVEEGHEVGNHLTRDEPSVRLTAAEFERALTEAHTTLSRFATVRWSRPASGWFTPPMINAMRRMNYRCALGSVYPYDATLSSRGFSTRYVLSHARPGAVIVLHDGGARGERTAEALSRILPRLAERGLRVVTLTELWNARQ